ncbi:MAG: glycosyltransferase family 2 protein [Candidatus Bathyarchaeota archaeon]|nr:glycosyltransferase family 2 protein [Candidatus Bathyarchaeota archaeon]
MKIACVIPAFNEEHTIKKVTKQASKFCEPIIVVDDGSFDRTANRALEVGAYVISHLLNLGTGAAISTGIKIALDGGANIIITMDGDGQHDPNDIPSLLEPILLEKADVTIGSRFLGNIECMPFHKRIGNRILSILNSILFNEKFTDTQSGFRAYSRDVFASILHESSDYSWASEMLIHIIRSKFKCIEVPIKTIYIKERSRGTSIIDGLRIFLRILSLKGKS